MEKIYITCKKTTMDAGTPITAGPAYAALVGILVLVLKMLLKYIYYCISNVRQSKCVAKAGGSETKLVYKSEDKGNESEPEDERDDKRCRIH